MQAVREFLILLSSKLLNLLKLINSLILSAMYGFYRLVCFLCFVIKFFFKVLFILSYLMFIFSLFTYGEYDCVDSMSCSFLKRHLNQDINVYGAYVICYIFVIFFYKCLKGFISIAIYGYDKFNKVRELTPFTQTKVYIHLNNIIKNSEIIQVVGMILKLPNLSLPMRIFIIPERLLLYYYWKPVLKKSAYLSILLI